MSLSKEERDVIVIYRRQKAIETFNEAEGIAALTISPEPDETTYLTMNPSNEKHLMESMAEKPTISFTPDEFKEVVGNILQISL